MAIDLGVTEQPAEQSHGYITLCKIDPAHFEYLIKVLRSICSKADFIAIDNNRLTQNVGSTIVTVDLTPILGDNNLTLHIVDPQRALSLMHTLKSNDDVTIYEDPQYQRYILATPTVHLFLPKLSQRISSDLTPYDLTGAVAIGGYKIPASEVPVIRSLLKSAEHAALLIKDNKIKGIYFKEVATYILPEYADEVKQLNEGTADECLKVNNLLPVVANEYEATLYKKDANFVLVTKCDFGMTHAIAYESVVSYDESRAFLGL